MTKNAESNAGLQKNAESQKEPQNTEPQQFIKIVGAKQNNLDNISINIPKNKLVVITGVSGSGKSSLAFETIYAEGQRRYVESLSTYARQFLQLQGKPDVESIEGLSPAIAIDQKTTARNPRSTVSTITEIYDYLRLLFARVGVPYSPKTNKPIKSQSVSDIVAEIYSVPKGSKIYILAPIVRGAKGEHRKELNNFRKQGFARVKIDEEIYPLSELPTINKNQKHNISVVVDRVVMNDELGHRVADSVETALRLADGIVHVEIVQLPEEIAKNPNAKYKDNQILIFSEKFACPESGFVLESLEPRVFSFNSPYGACYGCDGLGTELYFDPKRIVPNSQLSIREGAITIWNISQVKYYQQILESLAKHYNFDIDAPYENLTDKIKDIIMYGSGEEEIEMEYHDSFRNYKMKKAFEGVIPNIERKVSDHHSANWLADELGKYQDITKCRTCKGYRLRPEPLCVKINNQHIGAVTAFDINKAIEWFLELPKYLTETEFNIAERILKEINKRLHFLKNVGLEYLNLNRQSSTLSGGELQRIRLASQIGSGLTGVMYILDEPSIGLHQADNRHLIYTLKHLRDLGNTVIVVEHDEETMRVADYIVDVGPGAGIYGGKIIAKGIPEEIKNNKNSITGRYMNQIDYIAIPKNRREIKNNRCIKIINAREHNLKKITVEIPVGVFTCITGLSGSGKSTLIIDTLYHALTKKLNGTKIRVALHDNITGLHYIDKVIEIDQSPIGRTPRSNPATYTSTFTHIRDLFGSLPEAKARGYKASRFSFNVKGGRCENCQGDGMIKIEMHFLPDIYVECDVCKGKRYNKETLEILYKKQSISDVLEMTIADAHSFFKSIPSISIKLGALIAVGLGYMKVGQSATTLSGGEAQRVKLAKELCKRSTGRTLYIFDEPTTGLHTDDIKRLLTVLHRLADHGNSILVIEHNLDVIKTADWIIDMGPKGGNNGGQVIATGTPEDIIKSEQSITGKFLKKLMKNGKYGTI